MFFCNYTEWIWRLKLLFGAGPCCKKGGFAVLIQNVNWPQTVTLKAVKPAEWHGQECVWRSAATNWNLCWWGLEMGIYIRNTQGYPLIFWGSQVWPQKWGVVYQQREHFALCANVFHRSYQTADGTATCITNNTWTHEDLKHKNWQGYYKPESGDTNGIVCQDKRDAYLPICTDCSTVKPAIVESNSMNVRCVTRETEWQIVTL